MKDSGKFKRSSGSFGNLEKPQRGMRHSLRRAHEHLCQKSHHYRRWHEYPHHNKIHWAFLINYFLAIFLIVGLPLLDLARYKVYAASRNYSVSEQKEWENGSLTNLDSEDPIGSLRLASDGSFIARTWKTPPYSLTLGVAMASDGQDIYVLRGNGDRAFYKYSPATNSWTILADAPIGVYNGSHLEAGPPGTIFAFFGNYTKKFYKYLTATNTWVELADTPNPVGPGATMVYTGTYVFALRGSSTQDFWKYDLESNTWIPLVGPPGTIAAGADLVYDGSNYLYTLRGNGTVNFYRYSISGNSWTSMTSNYPTSIYEPTNVVYYMGTIYVQHGINTTTFYKCTISGTSCAGGWKTLTAFPATTRYAGLVYHSADGYIYAFRGNGTYDFWKYDIANNQFVGPIPFPNSVSTGGDLLWDGVNYVYGFRGSNSNAFYRYDISANSWTTLNSSGLGALNYDTKAVKVGNYIYVFQGGNSNFYRYDTGNDAGGWTAMAAAPASIGHGGCLIYPGSGDYIYATRGNGTTAFYAYSISNNNWTTFDPADLPTGAIVTVGGRLVTDGSNIYAILGNGNSKFYKYDITNNLWTQIGRVPFPPYYGTDLAYYNGKIYALAGYYKNKFYEYDIASGSWRKLANFQTLYLYDIGPWAGASLEYIGSNSLMVTRGGGYNDVLFYTTGSYNYLSSGSYQSPAIDLVYVSSWVSFNLQGLTPGDSAITVETRSSADAQNWSSWQAVLNGNIQSPPNRYIQVKITLNASSDRAQTPRVDSYTITYNSDETPPTNPTSFNCSSQEVGGVPLISGQSYPYPHPYCSFSGASDNQSGVAGYYVYFGPNANADPLTEGNYQTAASYVVNRELSSGTYYLLVKTKDVAGNVSSSSVTGFVYVYNGVSPYQSLTKTSSTDFSQGTLENVSANNDQLKLASKNGFWLADRLPFTPSSIGYGGSIAYKPSVGKLYVLRGNNTSNFWEYDLASNTWTAKSSTGLGTIYYGGMLVNGPGNYIYAIRGGGYNTFYRYDITNDAAGWSDADAEDAPVAFGYGGFLIYDGSRYIYAFPGNSTYNFYRFDPLTTADGQWDVMANVDFGYPDQTPTNVVYDGAALAYDGEDTIYAIQGGLIAGGFSKYSISQNQWTPLPDTLPMGPGNGAFLVWEPTSRALYYIAGNYTNRMFKYDPSTGNWSSVTSAPSTFAYGAFIQRVGDNFYVLRGNGSQNFYKYSISKDWWYTPTFNLFGYQWFGSSYFPVDYGSGIVKGDGDYFYAMRGGYDNNFVRYDYKTGTITPLARIPTGSYRGGALVYESTHNYIYAIVGEVERSLFRYDIATNTWTEEVQDPPPTQPSSGASLVYDGSRYIYYARGGGTNQWYRYDTQAPAGSRWSAALPTTGLGNLDYGAELVYKDGYLYTLRGGASNPNPFYRFDTSQLPGGSWTSLASLPAAVYNDGFLIDGKDGYLYAALGYNTNQWWRYSIANNSWTRITDIPAQVANGGNGASNGLDRILAFSGPGTNSWADGLYTYILQTENSSFAEQGSYTSEVLDLTAVYDWAGLEVNFQLAPNTNITIETQTSSNGIDWSAWQPVSQEKTVGTVHKYSINSPMARYLKVRFRFTSGFGIYSPTIFDYSVYWYQDLVAPNNPTVLAEAKSSASGGKDITSGNWYNYQNPYFRWPAEGEEGGASDNSGGSGVAGYWVYFGTDANAVPQTLGTYQTETSYTASNLTNGETYYLRIQTQDKAGNVQGTIWTAFIYKYDNQPPTNPSSLTVNPVGYTNIDDYTFYLSEDAADEHSGLAKYQYRTGGDPQDTWTDFDPPLATSVRIPNSNHPQGKYKEGVNQFYLRVVDVAGNASNPINVQYYFGSAAPSPPTNLTASPSSNTANHFSFSWDLPSAYIGDPNKITYYYSVNALPTQYNTNSTSVRAVGPAPFATQKGENVFYVVAKDEAGNIDWNQYASVVFTADTSAPPPPTAVNVSDISDKEAGEYRLVISWLAANIEDEANFAGYDIYASTNPTAQFERIATTNGTAYVHTNLKKDTRYYYYVKSRDKTGNESAPSSTVSALATGRYTKPPNLVKNPEAFPKAKSAKISWVTSREANSSVEYGTTPNLGAVTGNPSTLYVTNHEVTLHNLNPGTQYYFRVVYIDPDGNTGRSPIGSFITSPAPFISSVKTEDITLTSVLITWESNVPSYGEVIYGKTQSFGFAEQEEPYFTTRHMVKLKNLENDTTYYFQIRAKDEEGNLFTSDVYEVKTLALPKVFDVKVENKKEVDKPTVMISYKTNVETTTIVRYTPAGGKTKEYVASDYTTDHYLEISDLLPAHFYTLLITGNDKFGNQAQGQEHQITTLSDTMPPKILEMKERKKIIGEGANASAQLMVKLISNELTVVVIEARKGSGGSDFDIRSNDDPLNTEHNIVLKLGSPGSVYSWRARVKDASGNETVSEIKTIAVSQANKSAMEYILSVFSRSFGWLGKVFK